MVIQRYCQWYVLINNNENLHKYVINCKVTGHSVNPNKTGKHNRYHVSTYHNDCRKLVECMKQPSNHVLILF